MPSCRPSCDSTPSPVGCRISPEPTGPGVSNRSKTRTRWPARCRSSAAARPAGPQPQMATSSGRRGGSGRCVHDLELLEQHDHVLARPAPDLLEHCGPVRPVNPAPGVDAARERSLVPRVLGADVAIGNGGHVENADRTAGCALVIRDDVHIAAPRQRLAARLVLPEQRERRGLLTRDDEVQQVAADFGRVAETAHAGFHSGEIGSRAPALFPELLCRTRRHFALRARPLRAVVFLCASFFGATFFFTVFFFTTTVFFFTAVFFLFVFFFVSFSVLSWPSLFSSTPRS